MLVNKSELKNLSFVKKSIQEAFYRLKIHENYQGARNMNRSKKSSGKQILLKCGSIFSRQFKLFVLAFIVVLFVSIAASSAQTEKYQFISKWGSQGTDAGQFDHPYDVILDSSENILFVSDTNNHRIQTFTTDGKFVSTWGTYGNGHGTTELQHGFSHR